MQDKEYKKIVREIYKRTLEDFQEITKIVIYSVWRLYKSEVYKYQGKEEFERIKREIDFEKLQEDVIELDIKHRMRTLTLEARRRAFEKKND